ncbi:MFS transporter [Dialister succinatiphilus]|uniref:MFS transporter n=1 Tax=Dialister succinatiphilus TaxID=487173 RepID=UPI004027A3DD
MQFERRLDRKLVFSIIAAGILSFTGVVIETAMNVTFPSLMKEFSVSTALVQWITTGYLLVLAVVIPLSGYLKERFLMKRLFLTASGLFLLGTLLGRILQGAGTGIALPLMFNIIMDQAPLNRLGFMVGAGMLVCALAPAVGPSIGGYIVSLWGWRMIFWAVLPLLLLSFVLGGLSVRQSSDLRRPSFDAMGLLYLAVSFTCLLLGCTELGHGSITFTAALLFAGFLLALFLFRKEEKKLANQGKRPLLHMGALKNRPFVLGALGLSLLQFLCLALGFLLPCFSQIVTGENAFAAGCILLPGCLLGALFAPLSGRIYDRFGARRPVLLGSMFLILSMVLFNAALPFASTGILTVCYLFFAAGQGLSVGNILTYSLSVLDRSMKPDGNAICNTAQQLSGAVGTAVAAAIVSAAQTDGAGDFARATALGTAEALLVLLFLSLLQFLALFLSFRKEGRL